MGTTISASASLSGLVNGQVDFTGNRDRLTFIGSTTSGIAASGQNQAVVLQNDSWIVVSSTTASPLTVALKGSDANITVVDFRHNMRFLLEGQGAYTVTDNLHGPIGGAFITTAHSSVFVMGASAASLAHSVVATP